MSKLELYGIVYILTNPAMPNIVKIGMTSRESVDARLRELYNTSVPVPFECEYACKVKNFQEVERALHLAFQPYRIHPQREFFRINPEQAIAILKLLDNSRDITQEVSCEIINDLSEQDKAAGEHMKRMRRPSLNFVELGISIGSQLYFIEDDKEVIAVVSGEKKVLVNGVECSLTAVTRELLGLEYSVQPSPYWTYNGKKLLDIYNETYTIDE
jgi:hypothetical protein